MISHHGLICKMKFLTLFSNIRFKVLFIVLNLCYPVVTLKTPKEEMNMKTAAIRRTVPTTPAYPNAASRRYFLNRLLDGALAVATAVGTITALVFLIFM